MSTHTAPIDPRSLASNAEPTTKVYRTIPFGTRPKRATFVLEVTHGPDHDARIEVDPHHPNPLLIGQSESCELRLSDPQVSRRHVSVEVVGDRLRVTDLGSTNGTLV